VLTGEEEEVRDIPHKNKSSCGVADHMNEYDEKLNTSTIQEGDQRSILIIGGIRIFLPGIQAEDSMCVASAVAERQPTV
jgi:hypothetical protein